MFCHMYNQWSSKHLRITKTQNKVKYRMFVNTVAAVVIRKRPTGEKMRR